MCFCYIFRKKTTTFIHSVESLTDTPLCAVHCFRSLFTANTQNGLSPDLPDLTRYLRPEWSTYRGHTLSVHTHRRLYRQFLRSCVVVVRASQLDSATIRDV